MKDATPAADPPHVVIEDNFAMIPEGLLYDPTISAEAVRVYGVLLRHGQDPSNCHPGHRRIADFIGKSHRSVPAWIRELEVAGWIERFARKSPEGDWTSNGYIVKGRAGERGVRAEERRPSTPDSAGGTRQGARQKKAIEREQRNETGAVALLGAKQSSCSNPECSSGWVGPVGEVSPCPVCKRVMAS